MLGKRYENNLIIITSYININCQIFFSAFNYELLIILFNSIYSKFVYIYLTSFMFKYRNKCVPLKVV